MITPIQAFIIAGGEVVKITNLAQATAPKFDPDNPGGFAPAPAEVDVEGIYGGFETEGLPQGVDGRFTIEASSFPAGMTANQSQLERGAGVFMIVGWKERFYMGEIDGYTLHLKSGQ